MAKTYAYTEEEFIKAIKGSGGFVTEIAHRLRCSRKTVYRYKERLPAVASAMFEEKEHLLDSTESQLLKQINKGNMTGIIFYLKTQGYKRGYGDRTKLDIHGNFVSKDKRESTAKKDAEYVKNVMIELDRLKLVENEP